MYSMRLILAAALLAAPCGAAAQTIRGRVVADSVPDSVADLLVEAVARAGNPVASTRTDSAGDFVLRLSSAGAFTLRLAHPLFTAAGAIAVIVQEGESVAVELRMTRATVPLEPLHASAPRDTRLAGFYDRLRHPGSGQFLTRAHIDQRPGARTTDLLRDLRGVAIVSVGSGTFRPRVQAIALRGGAGQCTPSVYIDGIAVAQYSASGVDDLLRPDMLEGVEVYTAAASAPGSLQSRDGCGVIAFWTRAIEPSEPWAWRKTVGAAVMLTVLVGLSLLSR